MPRRWESAIGRVTKTEDEVAEHERRDAVETAAYSDDQSDSRVPLRCAGRIAT